MLAFPNRIDKERLSDIALSVIGILIISNLKLELLDFISRLQAI